MALNYLQGLICHKNQPTIYIYSIWHRITYNCSYVIKPNQTTIYMYKQDLALNNLHGRICHKTQLTNHIRVDMPYNPTKANQTNY